MEVQGKFCQLSSPKSLLAWWAGLGENLTRKNYVSLWNQDGKMIT